MISYIKTMLSGIKQWVSSQKADWSQNDETAANYIKGRPCYETDPKMEYLIKDETVTLETEEDAQDDWAAAELATNISLEDGKTYTVTWDGKEYSVAGAAFEQMAIIIGNMLLVGGDDTGEPFLIAFLGSRSFVYGLGAGAHTFSVATMGPRQVIPLPSKFLPVIPAKKLPVIPADKLPVIPAEKLPVIPAEKLPDIPAEKLPDNIVFVEKKTFDGTFDKTIEGRDTFKHSALNYYKISEFAPRRENVISFSGTRADGGALSNIKEGKNCCGYGLFIVVYQAGRCHLDTSFDAPSSGLYALCKSGNDFMTAGTYNFTYKIIRYIVQSYGTLKRYYLDVDDTGTLTATEITG